MYFIKQGKTNWKYILIVVILAAVVGGGILAWQYWGVPKEEIKAPADETADWKTYRNEEYGFEFKYPEVFDKFEDCKLREEDNNITVGTRFGISILDAKGLSLLEYVVKEKEELLREQLYPPPEEAWDQESIWIGGVEGIKVVWFYGPRYSQIIYLLKENRIFKILWGAGIPCLGYYVEMGLLDENEISYEDEIFEKIPFIFRFLE